jgi:hypothetical protein
MYKYPPHPPSSYIPFTPPPTMSSTCSSSPASTIELDQPQMARRRSGSPEWNWMTRGA